MLKAFKFDAIATCRVRGEVYAKTIDEARELAAKGRWNFSRVYAAEYVHDIKIDVEEE